MKSLIETVFDNTCIFLIIKRFVSAVIKHVHYECNTLETTCVMILVILGQKQDQQVR